MHGGPDSEDKECMEDSTVKRRSAWGIVQGRERVHGDPDSKEKECMEVSTGKGRSAHGGPDSKGRECMENMIVKQGWEFAHRFSKRIARFLPKNERISDLLKK